MWKKIQYCGKHILFMGFLPKKNSFKIQTSFRGNPSCVGEVVTSTVSRCNHSQHARESCGSTFNVATEVYSWQHRRLALLSGMAIQCFYSACHLPAMFMNCDDSYQQLVN